MDIGARVVHSRNVKNVWRHHALLPPPINTHLSLPSNRNTRLGSFISTFVCRQRNENVNKQSHPCCSRQVLLGNFTRMFQMYPSSLRENGQCNMEFPSATSPFCKLFKPHHEIETVAVRTCANFQITSTTESEDREVWSSTRFHTNLSYLTLVPNHRSQPLSRV